MTNYNEHNVTANGIRINYYRSTPEDNAPPLVMLHGLTDSGLVCWMRVADALRGSYDIILPDARGHGLSARPAEGYFVEDLAADTAGLIDTLGLDRPALIGHSMGGMTATAVAALYPEKVRALVLEDPAWLDGGTPEGLEGAADNWCADLSKDQSLGRDGLIALAHEKNPDWHADELSRWAENRLRMNHHPLRQILTSLRPGWKDLLGRIQCPILLVTGDPECGVIINPAMLKEAFAINPRIREAHVPNAGHGIHRDQFGPYIQKVRAFLEDVYA